MSPDTSFAALMRRLREGDNEAASLIWHRFSNRLAALARSHLCRLVRQKVDPDEVMASAFRSFFRGHREGQFAVDTWEGLWALLTVITLRKCGYKTRLFFQERRDVRREKPLPHGEEDVAAWEPIAHEPTPEEAALHAETVQQAFRGLRPDGRLVLELALQGYTISEISERVKISERSVYRILAEIRKRLERQNGQDDPGV